MSNDYLEQNLDTLDDLYKKNILFVVDKIEEKHEILKEVNYFISGGSLINLRKEYTDINDIDVFFYTKKDFDIFEKSIVSRSPITGVEELLSENEWLTTKFAITDKVGFYDKHSVKNIKIQFISYITGNYINDYETVLDSFDFFNSAIMYDPKRKILSKHKESDSAILKINPNYDFTQIDFFRVYKYLSEKDFFLSEFDMKRLLKSCLLGNNGRYYYTRKHEIDDIDKVKQDSLFYFIQFFSLIEEGDWRKFNYSLLYNDFLSVVNNEITRIISLNNEDSKRLIKIFKLFFVDDKRNLNMSYNITHDKFYIEFFTKYGNIKTKNSDYGYIITGYPVNFL